MNSNLLTSNLNNHCNGVALTNMNNLNGGVNNLGAQMGLGSGGNTILASAAAPTSSSILSNNSLNIPSSSLNNISNIQSSSGSQANPNGTTGMLSANSMVNLNGPLINGTTTMSSGLNNMSGGLMSATMTHMLGNIGNGMTGIPTGVAVGINGSLNSINGMGGLNSLTNMGNMRSDDCDDDGRDDGEVREQDRFLPVANIARIMKTVLPPNAKIAKDAKETIQECVSEFISFITSEASDKCLQEKRKTINGDDLLWAMSTLGFDRYIEPLKIYLNKYRDAVKGDKPEKKTTTGKKGEMMSSPSGMIGGMSHHSQSHQIIVSGIADDPILSAIASTASNMNSNMPLPAISSIQSTYMNPDFDPRKRDLTIIGNDWDALSKKPKHG